MSLYLEVVGQKGQKSQIWEENGTAEQEGNNEGYKLQPNVPDHMGAGRHESGICLFFIGKKAGHHNSIMNSCTLLHMHQEMVSINQCYSGIHFPVTSPSFSLSRSQETHIYK